MVKTIHSLKLADETSSDGDFQFADIEASWITQ